MNYYIRNGEVLERVEADERTVVRFHGNTDRVKDTVHADFEEPMIDVGRLASYPLDASLSGLIGTCDSGGLRRVRPRQMRDLSVPGEPDDHRLLPATRQSIHRAQPYDDRKFCGPDLFHLMQTGLDPRRPRRAVRTDRGEATAVLVSRRAVGRESPWFPYRFSKIETPHLFAVMHPYADMIPLLTKLKGEKPELAVSDLQSPYQEWAGIGVPVV